MNPNHDLSLIFDPATHLPEQTLEHIKKLNYNDDRTLRSGNRYDDTMNFNGQNYPFIKAKRITLDSNSNPDPGIVFGTIKKWFDPIPRAFFIVAETLVIRLTGKSINLHFPYSPEPIPPDAPRAPFKTPDYHIGSDGEPGHNGIPAQFSKAYLGPPIHFFFKNLQLQGNPEPGDIWLKIRATGSRGQNGGVGGTAGNCWYGQHYCTTANGRGGRGGDAAHGFGGGQFFIYSSAETYKDFRDVTQFIIEGGEAGAPGKPGGAEPPQATPPDFGPGLPGKNGNVGDIHNITDVDISKLFS